MDELSYKTFFLSQPHQVLEDKERIATQYNKKLCLIFQENISAVNRSLW